MKHVSSLLIVTVFILLFGASATQKQVVTQAPTKRTFTYDYKTPTPSRPGSAKTLLSLIRPRYAEHFAYRGSDVFVNFQQSIATDIEELLIDRGYTLKGPYQSFDEMVFNDKKDADVAIEIEIDPKFTASEGGWKTYVPFDLLNQHPPTYYYYQGSISLIGKINIVGREPLSQEKLLVKSVEIPSILNINISTSSKGFARPVFDQDFFNDPNVYNALGAALQEQYRGIMQKIDAHFDPQEFASLKAQVKELKARKAF